LSLFDGMSCGQIALNRVGIEYDNYFASEIDEKAIYITQKNVRPEMPGMTVWTNVYYKYTNNYKKEVIFSMFWSKQFNPSLSS